jgi:hypothetical protein
MGMGFDGGAIDGAPFPFHVRLGIVVGLEGLENAVPGAICSPSRHSVGAGLPGTIALWQISPRGSGASDPADAIDDLAVGAPLSAAFAGFFGWQQGLQPLPFTICHITARHACLPPKGKYANASSFVRHALNRDQPGIQQRIDSRSKTGDRILSPHLVYIRLPI